MRACSLLATAALFLCATLPALGQGPGPDRVREMLRRMDSNKDGRVERAEVPEAERARFTRMLEFANANGNGAIDRDEVETLVARARNQANTQPKAATVQEPRDSTGLVPLPDLKSGAYKGKEGGLYAGGSNQRPARHEEAGLRLARSIQPLDAEGRPASDGKIVLLSIGMSNTTQEFSAFKAMADADPDKHPKLAIVDGAQGGMTARIISQPESPNGKRYWDTVDQRLKAAGVTRAQVQAAWIKEADARPSATRFPDYAVALEDELLLVAQLLKERFPNLKLGYLSSRIYGGYATTPLNPEPYAYESGFSVKWLIGKQIDGDLALNHDPDRGPVKAPWLAWGPYLWADGAKPRGDGLTYAAADLGPDGTHPSNSGRRIVARQLLSFFKSDSTTRPWFVARPQQ